MLRLPMIGLLINLLDELVVIVVRILRNGFRSGPRANLLYSVLLLPNQVPEDVVFVEHQLFAVTHQRIATVVLLMVDFFLIVYFLTTNSGVTYSVREYLALTLNSLCSLYRFLLMRPRSIKALRERFVFSRSILFVEYSALGSSIFVFVSVSISAFFVKKTAAWAFSLGVGLVLAFSIGFVACIFKVLRRDVTYHSTVTITALYLLSFAMSAVLRGSHVGNYDDVTALSRWFALVGWSCILSFSVV